MTRNGHGRNGLEDAHVSCRVCSGAFDPRAVKRDGGTAAVAVWSTGVIPVGWDYEGSNEWKSSVIRGWKLIVAKAGTSSFDPEGDIRARGGDLHEVCGAK